MTSTDQQASRGEACLASRPVIWPEETEPRNPQASYYRARYYDQTVGRFLSEDPAKFDGGIDFYAYVRNNPANFNDPFGLYTQEPDVPPLNPRLDKFMNCMDDCTGKQQHVNATTNGTHSDPGHAAGTTVDIRPIGTPSKGPNGVYCCAGKCGAARALDERPGYSSGGVQTKHGKGPHFHLQLVPTPGATTSMIPDTPECKPGGCDAKKDGKK